MCGGVRPTSGGKLLLDLPEKHLSVSSQLMAWKSAAEIHRSAEERSIALDLRDLCMTVPPRTSHGSEPYVGSSLTHSNRCGVRRVGTATPHTLGTCRWTRLQLVTYKLAMLFGLTTRKRIVSSGLCSPTVGSSLSYGRLVVGRVQKARRDPGRLHPPRSLPRRRDAIRVGRNLRAGQPVQIRLKGKRRTAEVEVITDEARSLTTMRSRPSANVLTRRGPVSP
jgi:hypothetical protein